MYRTTWGTPAKFENLGLKTVQFTGFMGYRFIIFQLLADGGHFPFGKLTECQPPRQIVTGNGETGAIFFIGTVQYQNTGILPAGGQHNRALIEVERREIKLVVHGSSFLLSAS
ncbi:hypothetical protein Xekk_00001 [Xenorhabdus sp. KK7.4]|nr:hypothetical protein Xekk_01970 [Xenorhabdus sp. KK7.4]PHM59590.1 hypothetical protein Xekk_00001 [Xenorhabdus sp. KK7.4]